MLFVVTANATTVAVDADIPAVVKKFPAASAPESSNQLVMETKLKIIEILQVALQCFFSSGVVVSFKDCNNVIATCRG